MQMNTINLMGKCLKRSNFGVSANSVRMSHKFKNMRKNIKD